MPFPLRHFCCQLVPHTSSESPISLSCVIKSGESKVNIEISPSPRETKGVALVNESATRITGVIRGDKNCPPSRRRSASSRRCCLTRDERSPQARPQDFGDTSKISLSRTVKNTKNAISLF